MPPDTIKGVVVVRGDNSDSNIITSNYATFFGGVDAIIYGCTGSIGSDSFVQTEPHDFTIPPTAKNVSTKNGRASLDGDTAYEWVRGTATSPSGSTYQTSVYIEIKISDAGQDKVKGQ